MMFHKLAQSSDRQFGGHPRSANIQRRIKKFATTQLGLAEI